MFIVVSKSQQATQPVDQHLYNPKNPGNPMTLFTYRTQARWPVAIVNSKKASAEFYDAVTNKKIPRASWTADMSAFALQKVAEVPRPPFIFKITVIGWIAIAFFAAIFAWLAYDTFKPAQRSAEQVEMEQTPEVGDTYFGRYEKAPEPGSLAAMSGLGFGWFQVVNVDGDTYFIAKSTDMSSHFQPMEDMDSASFESESVATQITEHLAGHLVFTALDESVTFYITDKK